MFQGDLDIDFKNLQIMATSLLRYSMVHDDYLEGAEGLLSGAWIEVAKPIYIEENCFEDEEPDDDEVFVNVGCLWEEISEEDKVAFLIDYKNLLVAALNAEALSVAELKQLRDTSYFETDFPKYKLAEEY